MFAQANVTREPVVFLEGAALQIIFRFAACFPRR